MILSFWFSDSTISAGITEDIKELSGLLVSLSVRRNNDILRLPQITVLSEKGTNEVNRRGNRRLGATQQLYSVGPEGNWKHCWWIHSLKVLEYYHFQSSLAVTSSDSSLLHTSWVCISKSFDVQCLGFSSQLCCKQQTRRWERFWFNIQIREWMALAAVSHTHLPYGQVCPSQPDKKSQNEKVHVQMSRTLLTKVSSQVQWLTYVVSAHKRLKLED